MTLDAEGAKRDEMVNVESVAQHFRRDAAVLARTIAFASRAFCCTPRRAVVFLSSAAPSPVVRANLYGGAAGVTTESPPTADCHRTNQEAPLADGAFQLYLSADRCHATGSATVAASVRLSNLGGDHFKNLAALQTRSVNTLPSLLSCGDGRSTGVAADAPFLSGALWLSAFWARVFRVLAAARAGRVGEGAARSAALFAGVEFHTPILRSCPS